MGDSILALGLGSGTETQEPQQQHDVSGEAVVPELRNVSQLAVGTSKQGQELLRWELSSWSPSALEFGRKAASGPWLEEKCQNLV